MCLLDTGGSTDSVLYTIDTYRLDKHEFKLTEFVQNRQPAILVRTTRWMLREKVSSSLRAYIVKCSIGLRGSRWERSCRIVNLRSSPVSGDLRRREKFNNPAATLLISVPTYRLALIRRVLLLKQSALLSLGGCFENRFTFAQRAPEELLRKNR